MTGPALKPSILTFEEWQTKYPIQDYKDFAANQKTADGKIKNLTSKVAVYRLHYLLSIRGEGNDKVIMDWINKHPEDLTRADPSYHGLTPFLMMTMQGRVSLVRVALDKWKETKAVNKNLMITDEYGWTALHHATLASADIAKLLRDNGASDKVVTNNGLDCEELERLITRDVKSRSINRVSFRTPVGTLTPFSQLSGAELFEKFGLRQYRDGPYVPPESYKTLWQHPPLVVEAELDPKTIDEQLNKETKQLVVGPCKELQDVAPHAFELFAGEDLPKGTFVEEYAGSLRSDTSLNFKERFNQKSDPEGYLYYKLDGQEIGSVTRFANYRWPKAVMVHIKAGGMERMMLTIADPAGVKKGEAIGYCYGLGCMALLFNSPNAVLGREEMRDFFSKGLKACIKEAEQIIKQTKTKPSLDFILNLERICFPLHFPTALLDLHFSGIVTAPAWDELELVLPKISFLQSWRNKSPMNTLFVVGLIKQLVKLEKQVEDKEQVRKIIADWVFQQIGKISLLKIVKGLDMIYRELMKENTNNIGEEFLRNLEDYLSKYDYLSDQDSPLSLKNVMGVVVESTISSGVSKALLIKKYLEVVKQSKEQGYSDTDDFMQMNKFALESLLDDKKKDDK